MDYAFRVVCKTVPIKGTTSDVGGRLSDTIIKNTTMERSVVIPMETCIRDVRKHRRHTRCNYIGNYGGCEINLNLNVNAQWLIHVEVEVVSKKLSCKTRRERVFHCSIPFIKTSMRVKH